jgi:acetyl esterase/lipase
VDSPRLERYGGHPDQHVEFVPAEAPRRGLAVLVHGGFWRERHTLELMRPLSQSLAGAGWEVANVEYRRGPAAVWPAPLEDVRAACALADAARRDPQRGPAGPLVGIGHSVGGQLALLAGGPLDAVVALAPVTDTARTHAEALGEAAAEEYFGTGPAGDPARYADASPIARLPVGRPALLVHGSDDDRVPVRHTLDFLAAALEAGDAVDAVLPHRLGHRDAIDPGNGSWPGVLEWMARRQDSGAKTLLA